MSHGVLFFSHGTAHCARLLVACHSLRQHYSGPATILDTGESGGIVEKIAAACGLEVRRIEFVQRRRNSAYCTKSTLWRHSPYDATVYLDADTITLAPLDPLFAHVASHPSGVVLTRFAEWASNGKIVGGRVSQWLGMEPLEDVGIYPDALAKACLSSPQPAVNTGIFGWRRGASAFMAAWEALTLAGWKKFIPDEISCQLLCAELPHLMLSDAWNFSPVYSRGIERAKIAHFHGHKMVERPDGRGAEGHEIWFPHFLACWRQNLADCQSWLPAGDQHLAAYVWRLREGVNVAA